MRSLLSVVLMMFGLSSLFGQEAVKAPVPPPQADAVSVTHNSRVESATVAGTAYWKVILVADYTAIGNRDIIAQVYNPQTEKWIMMMPMAIDVQGINGDAIQVVPGQGRVRFEHNVLKSSAWGQYLTAMGDIENTPVWVGSYGAVDTLKASDTGALYRR